MSIARFDHRRVSIMRIYDKLYRQYPRLCVSSMTMAVLDLMPENSQNFQRPQTDFSRGNLWALPDLGHISICHAIHRSISIFSISIHPFIYRRTLKCVKGRCLQCCVMFFFRTSLPTSPAFLIYAFPLLLYCSLHSA